MSCATCGRTNPAHARFCGGCGMALAPRCPSCGAECEADARFCTSCGAPRATPAGPRVAPAPAAVARKVVTVVFADLIGSVALHERLDAESGRRVMERYHRAMAAAVELHGGRVVQLLGDGVLAVFGVPRVAEDDAIRAVRAGVGMQRAYREMVRAQGDAGPLAGVGLRVAVNTGEMVVGDDETVIGDTTNVAARLQHEARDGDVIVGEGTQRLVEDLVTLAPLGAFALRGRAEAVRAWRVVSLDRPASARATPFVGREKELGRLRAVWEDSVASRSARLAVLLGSPGLGKSRLVAEIARRGGERATVLAARCDAAGGATFAPIAEALRPFLRVDEGTGGDALRAAVDALVPGDEVERARILSGVGALFSGAPSSPEETFFAVRRLLAAFAVVRPVVLVIDDLHWAAPLLLDLVEHLVQWSSDVPLLVLVAARPELRDVRSSLATAGGLVADVVTLGGLDAASSMQLAAGVVGAAELPAALVGRVLATSEGNPLFLAELVRMLVQDGVLRRDGERWVTTVEVAQLDMPPTIHVLLAARIERLRPEERVVLERAAVVGRQFSRAAVAQLAGGDTAQLDARLEALKRSELIEPDTGWFLGEPALRFHHVLIRDAAYRRVLKETRAELHERLAGWIAERVGAAEGLEHEETLGWHYEQAHLNLRELGALDERGRALGERAARHLGAAGRRALARDDLALAAGLLGRAIEALAPGHELRAELAPDWCEALLSAGDVETAAGAIDELERCAGDSDRLRAWHACFAGQLAALTDPQSLRATAERVAAAAEVLAAAGDAPGEAKAYAVHAGALARLGAMGACEAALDQALAAARRARDRRRANSVLAGAPVAALWGPSPVTRASGRCLDVVRVLRITQGAPAVEAVALRCQAVLEALRGRGEAARRMVASARRMVEELGLVQQLLEADVFAALIELLEGDAATAEAFLAKAYAGLREHGLAIDAARAAALLGRALLAQGRADEAEALSHESESLAGDDLKAAIAWRGVRAEALARRGEATAAVGLARAAVEVAAATDALLDHADARIALAAALRAAGHAAEAAAEEWNAAELWRQKGATLLLARVPVTAATEAAAVALPRTIAGRVRENAATAEVARLDAAVAARDLDAVRALFASLVESVHHPLGVTLTGSDGAVESVRRVLQHSDLAYRHETIATLGERLALSRQHVATGGVHHATVDVGPVDAEHVWLSQVDATGRRVYSECFAPSQLGHALVRLYELHASLEPDGVPRERAATAARVLEVNLRGRTADGLERDAADLEQVLAPAISFHDHRTVGFGSLRGAQRYLDAFRRLRAISNDSTATVDAVLAARPDGVVLRRTSRGTIPASGGAFESVLVDLYTFDERGRLERVEVFDGDREGEALVRFDTLLGEDPPAALPSRVRPTAAAAEVACFEAAVLTHDAAQVEQVIAALEEVVHHPLRVTWDRDGARTSIGMLLDNQDLELRHVVVATLGERLALSRQYASSSNVQRGDFDVGAVHGEQIVLSETDGHGRRVRAEFFAIDHLAHAIVRLYERHAALLPEGEERRAAAAIACGVAAVLGFDDGDGAAFRAVLAHDVRFADHQTLGLGALCGAERLRTGNLILHDVARDMTSSVVDVLAVEPDALVAHRLLRGTDRSHGGAFERDLVELWVFDEEGRLAHLEHFRPDDVEHAMRRLASLRPATVPDDVANAPATASPSVHENFATAYARRLDAVWAAAEVDALESVFAPELEVVHHPTAATYGRAEAVQRFGEMVDSGHGRLDFRHEPLATLGEALALCRARSASRGMVFGGIDARALEIEYFVVVRADAAARSTRVEVFASDRLSDAVVRFYEMHAEDARSGARVRAVALARAVGAVVPMDVEEIGAVLAPDVAFADRRRLGLGTARGAERYLHGLRSLVELTRDSVQRTTDVLVATERALLLRRHTTGLDRTSDGTFELELLMLWAFGDDARIMHIELFEVQDAASARARADELARPEPLDGEAAAAARARPRRAGAAEAQPFVDNAATRVETRMRAALAALDRDAIERLVAPAFRAVDRRRGALVEADRESYLTSFWPMLESLTAVRQRVRHLATRGERMSLGHVHWWAEQADGRGPVELEWLSVIGVDDAGRLLFEGEFDPHDLEAARAELDERYAAGEGAAHPTVLSSMRTFAEAFARRDWDALVARCAPDLVANDHRRLGWEPLHGPGAYVAALRALIDLAPDTRMRLDHVETAARGFLVRTTWVGTREGGRFEEPSLMVGEVDEAGRVVRFDQYEPDRLDAARARFARIGADRASDALARWRAPNAATRARDRVEAAIRSRDWAAMHAAFAPGATLDDRRRLLRTTIAADQAVELMRETVERAPDFRSERRLLAVFGDRIAVEHQTWGGTPDGAPVEAEMLVVHEVDTAGRLVAVVDFDTDDRRAAFREANARLAALEPEHAILHGLSAAFFDAAAERDAARMRALHADDVVVQSWRRSGIEVLEGVDACMASIEALWELTTHTEVEVVAILAMEPFGSVALTRLAGTLRDGGRFETLLCGVVLIEADRFVRFEQFEPDDAERALERFAELSAQRGAELPGTLRIPPNTASRASDHSRELNRVGDAAGMRALCAEDAVFDDRRPLVRTVGGRDMMVADAGQIPPEVWRHSTHELLATSGDRLCLHRHLFRGDPRAGTFEIETLTVTEVDPAGRIVALVIYGPDDRRAAAAEMMERYARGEGAGVMPRAVVDCFLAMHSGDVETMRAALDPDFDFLDHRRTGLGRRSGEEYLESFRALCAMADEIGTEVLWHVATAAHGSVSVGRLWGMLRDGGPFESLVVRVNVWEGERFLGTEIFELDDLDRARARFDEIGRERAARDADPLRIPPNAATRAGERLRALALDGDWDALRELCAPDFVFEDRRALFRVSGDRDTLVANSRHIAREVWQRATRTLLATHGDRLALHRNHWRGPSGGASFEVEILEVTELDAEGRLVASVIFDVDDRRAAAVDMLQRYMSGEGARTMPARQVEFLRAMNAHDLAAARAALDDDFTFVDHRRTGVGRLAGADEYVASLAALFEQSADLTTDVLYHVAIAEHGSMSVGRMFGTLRSGGGPFESVFVRINRYEDGHCRGVEVFELDDLAAASERFARLGRDHATRVCGPVRIPANAAFRAFERWNVCIAARDWEALREQFTPDAVWEDRRPLLAMTGDRDQLVEIARLAVSVRLAPAERSVLAAPGERLLLTWNLFRQGGDEGGPDIEMLQLFEVDQHGRFVAVAWFEGADHRGANLALHQRLAATVESDPIRRVAAFACAVGERDLVALRALLPDDLVYDDHRDAGPGRLDGAGAYAWAESLLERCPDACLQEVFHLAATDRAVLWVGRASGMPGGGGPGEALFAAVVAADRVDVYALEDLAVAQARFDELRTARGGSSS